MKWDFTVNPGYIVTWAILVGGLIWRMGAFVTEFRNLIAQFTAHEKADDVRFAALDDRLRALHDRMDDLRNRGR